MNKIVAAGSSGVRTRRAGSRVRCARIMTAHAFRGHFHQIKKNSKNYLSNPSHGGAKCSKTLIKMFL